MRRPAVLAAALTLGAAALPAPASALSPPPPQADAACTRTSWVAGTVDLCNGELIYRDYVYDDYGAHDPVQYRLAPATGPLARPYGAQRYPEGAESTADIVDLTVRIVGGELEAVFELNALYEPDQTLALLFVDADNNPATRTAGVAAFEFAHGVAWKGSDVILAGSQGNPVTNTVTLRGPVPPGDTWRIGAYTAQKATGQVMNVAFRGREVATPHSGGTWFEDRQATALRNGDISEFAHVLHVDDLRRKVTRGAPAVPGFQERVYTSAFTLPPGEGMSYTKPHHGRHGDTGAVCEQEFHYFGKYQPYAVYVPSHAGPHGVQLTLHGCSAGMTTVIGQPGMQADVGEARNRILVSPLGRGPYGYYSDISERDVVDVLADVFANHTVATDRVFSGGYSMGGYGAYRMAALYPDLFAGAIAWVGFTGDGHNNPVGPSPSSEPSGAIGNVIDFVRNLRHIPTAMLYTGEDELVHAQSAVAMQQRFDAEQGGAYEWFFHPAGEHFTLALADDWRKESDWSKDLTRVELPARVVFRTDRALDYPAYGLVHNQAYWVRGIRPRGDGYADVDLKTFACGRTEPTYTEGSRQGPDPVPWHSENRLPTGTTAVERRDAIEGALLNVSAVEVDAVQTCVAGKAVAYRIVTDGPATLRLDDDREVTFAAAGTHEGVIAAAGPTAPGAPAEALPATGSGLAFAAFGLLGAAWLSRPSRRRRQHARG